MHGYIATECGQAGHAITSHLSKRTQYAGHAISSERPNGMSPFEPWTKSDLNGGKYASAQINLAAHMETVYGTRPTGKNVNMRASLKWSGHQCLLTGYLARQT